MLDTFLTEARPRLHVVATRSATPTTRPPVLMLHGLWHSSWAWENWSTRLADHGYDCYAVDLRGHGKSEGQVRDARVRDYLTDARRAVAAMPRQPILVGHSLGGALVQHLLAGEDCRAGVLVASVPGRYPLGPVLRTAVRRPLRIMEAAVRHDLRPLVDTAAATREVLFGPDTPEAIVTSTQRRLEAAAPRVIRDLMLTRAARPRPGTPILVLGATHDTIFSTDRQRRRARRLGADYREIEGSGHDIPLDTEWQVAADAAASWLEARVR